jgi:hypothetical protein
MGKLVNAVLPKAYEAYDANLKKIEKLGEGKVIYSNTFVISKYVKNLVEVSIWMGKLYIFLKRTGKPDAYSDSPLFKKKIVYREPYTGPKMTPDEDGFAGGKHGYFE